MPAKWLRLKCRHVFTFMAVVLLVPAGVQAQTGGVTLRASVSETVTLSVVPNFTHGNVDANVVSSGNTVRVTLSSDSAGSVRVPLLVRSNSNFKISATVESTATVPTLSVIDVRATGSLVSPQAVNQLNALERKSEVPLDLSQPVLVASGPRVSLGGTLNSPNNALQITVLIRLPEQGRGAPVHLTFAATAGSPVQ